MPINDIAALLQRVGLDRETKSQIIAILASRPDDRVVADIEALLRSFDEMDEQERGLLAARFAAIEAAYQESVKAAATALEKEILKVQDEAQRNEEIERIRKSLT